MKRAVKVAALLWVMGIGALLLVNPTGTIGRFLEWLPSIVILVVLGSIIVWDMRYERKQEKERGK